MIWILFSAVLPALVLVFLIYRKDQYRKEPARQLVKAFCYGCLAAPASLLLSTPAEAVGLFTLGTDGVAAGFRTALFGAALPEELFKLAFLWLLLRRNPDYDEYVDGIVYAVCVGMGFAALENIGYLFQNMDNWGTVGTLRAIFSVPAHFFFAVAMGYFFACGSFGDPARRSVNYALALLVPVAQHTAFDWLAFCFGTPGILGGLAIALFFGLYILMAKRSRQRVRAHLDRDREIMDAPHLPDIPDLADVPDLTDPTIIPDLPDTHSDTSVDA
ncbi:MAG: PrsW family intramembrane metalloprotease [Bacteroidales bacterium]|nr:PrsW family intramembrane metalloprotease [Bacteroidales bacterium]